MRFCKLTARRLESDAEKSRPTADDRPGSIRAERLDSLGRFAEDSRDGVCELKQSPFSSSRSVRLPRALGRAALLALITMFVFAGTAAAADAEAVLEEESTVVTEEGSVLDAATSDAVITGDEATAPPGETEPTETTSTDVEATTSLPSELGVSDPVPPPAPTDTTLPAEQPTPSISEPVLDPAPPGSAVPTEPTPPPDMPKPSLPQPSAGPSSFWITADAVQPTHFVSALSRTHADHGDSGARAEPSQVTESPPLTNGLDDQRKGAPSVPAGSAGSAPSGSGGALLLFGLAFLVASAGLASSCLSRVLGFEGFALRPVALVSPLERPG
jgi:hypothetical protein